MQPFKNLEGVHAVHIVFPGFTDFDTLSAPGHQVNEYRTDVVIAHSDPGIRTLLAAVLKKDGYCVFKVTDGIELLEWLADRLLDDKAPGMPDIIVAEINLPGRRGIDILADLRGSGLSTPFIFTVRPEDDAMTANARRLGSVAMFQTPFDIDDFRTSAFYFSPPRQALLPLQDKRCFSDGY
jgi:CheY-like chemotaxis protein